MIVALVNLKGGVGKTTTAIYLAAALSRSGQALLVDADPRQSALSWADQAGIDCVALPVRNLSRSLPPIMAAFAHAVIDTPPNDPAVARAALAAADLAVIPTSPSLIDLDRLPETINLVAEFPDLPAGVLLVRSALRSRARAAAREVLPEFGVPLLDAEIPQKVAFVESFGTTIEDLGAYEAVAAELGMLLGDDRKVS